MNEGEVMAPQVVVQTQASTRAPWWLSRQWLLSAEGEAKVMAMEPPAEPPSAAMGREYQQGPEELILGTYGDGVASLSIQGVLMSSAPYWCRLDTDYDVAAKLVRAADVDPSVRALILEIDSPGGEAAGVSILADAVRDASTPVVVQVVSGCCSAAYWVASQADFIVAGPSAVLGSIGAINRSMSMEALLKKMGLQMATQRSKQSPDKALNPAESKRGSELRQEMLNNYGAMFHRYVAAGRGVTPEHVAANYGKGKCFNGEEALALGLIDAVGQLPDAIAKAKQLADERAPAPAINNNPAMSRTEEGMSQQDNTTPAAAGNEDALKAQVSTLTTERDGLTEQLTAAQSDLTAAQESVTALTAERDELATQVSQYKAEALAAQKAQALEPLKASGQIAGAMVAVAERAWDKTHVSGDPDAWADFQTMIGANEPMVDTSVHTTTRAPETPQDPNAADDQKIRDYCKENGLNADNSSDYVTAHRALGLN